MTNREFKFELDSFNIGDLYRHHHADSQDPVRPYAQFATAPAGESGLAGRRDAGQMLDQWRRGGACRCVCGVPTWKTQENGTEKELILSSMGRATFSVAGP
jgi:hypothetical protein